LISILPWPLTHSCYPNAIRDGRWHFIYNAELLCYSFFNSKLMLFDSINCLYRKIQLIFIIVHFRFQLSYYTYPTVILLEHIVGFTQTVRGNRWMSYVSPIFYRFVFATFNNLTFMMTVPVRYIIFITINCLIIGWVLIKHVTSILFKVHDTQEP